MAHESPVAHYGQESSEHSTAPARTRNPFQEHSCTGYATFATELANSDVSVYTRMKLLGHESMATSQRYVAAAGAETRSAAARNPLHALISDRPASSPE